MGGIRNAPLLISAAEAKERVMKIQHFFDKRTSTLTYVVHDEAAKV